MLDLNFIRQNPEKVKKNNQIRKCSVDVDEVLKLDYANRGLITKIENLRSRVNQISRGGKPSDKEISEVKEVKAEIDGLQANQSQVEQELNNLLLELPNTTHESVPIGEDERGNVIHHRWGSIPQFSFAIKDHIELGEMHNLIDTERGSKVSGARFWYIKNDLVFLEFALIQYALDFFARKEGFLPMLPPMIVREQALFGTGFFPTDKHEVYKLENDTDIGSDYNNLYLIGTAEVALASYHADEVIDLVDGSKKYIGFSSCFRREAGTYSKDLKGIFRGHQFDKLELFIFCREEESWRMHEYLLEISEKFWQSLSIPYQVLNMCSGDIGAPNAKKYDIEGWFPGQNKYRELGSCSNDTDFQARRLNIKYEDDSGAKKFAHTLNHTACALGRTIIAIMENYQKEDGAIWIPDVLIPYCGGKKLIGERMD